MRARRAVRPRARPGPVARAPVALRYTRKTLEDIKIKRQQILRRIQRALSPDLLSKTYADEAKNHPVAGHCYIAAEALYHALGGKSAGLTAQVARDPSGGTHWWLIDNRGRILDPTKEQYTAFAVTPPYAVGRGAGFLTRQPSRRARIVLERAGLAAA